MNRSAWALALYLFFLVPILSTCSKETEEPAVNRLPEIDAPLDALAFADSLFTLTIGVEDQDGDPVVVTAEGLPSWLSFDAAALKLRGTPGRQHRGTHTVKIVADDGEGQRSRNIDIEVIILYSLQEKLDNELEERWKFDTPGLLGVSVAVVTPDEQLLTSTQGNHDFRDDEAVDPGHRYRVASVSKVFTTALVLRLAEEGYFQIDDKLFDYLPLVGLQNGEAITIRHLLTHTSGLVDHLNSNDFFTGNYTERTWTNEDIFDYAIDKGLLFNPGTNYAYSNTGFYILGALAEKVLDQPLRDAYEQWIFQPLGLQQTLYDDFSNRDTPIDSLAENNRAYEYHQSAVGAAGAIVSTPSDIARFGKAVYGGKFLSAASLADMTTDHGAAAGGEHYGLGTNLWFDNNIIQQGHSGALMNYRAVLIYVPGSDFCLALATNDPHPNWYDLVNGVLVEVNTHFR